MSKTIEEWKKYYTPLPEQASCDTLIEQLTRKTCLDVQEICGIAEQLQVELEQLRILTKEIEAISCGENQVAENDSEGMGVIYKLIKKETEK